MQGTCEPSARQIDRVSAPAFAAAMRTEIDWADNRAVVIDCSAITFMDTGAFHALIDAHRYALDHGHLLVISNLQRNCAQAIRQCAWHSALTIETP
jgi:anti-anti-sigma factor